MKPEELKTALGAVELKVNEALTSVNNQIAKYGEASTAAKGLVDSTLAQWKDLHDDEMKAIKADLLEVQQKQVAIPQNPENPKSLGNLLIESEGFKAVQGKTANRGTLELKNTIVTGGDNSVTRMDQLPGVVAGDYTQLTVLPTLMTGGTDSNIVYYSQELAHTINAAGTAEGAVKPESVLTFSALSEPVKTIAHFIKMSKQAMDDSTFLASYVDQFMRQGVRDVTEIQVITGDGIGENLNGWLAAGNFTTVSPLLTVDSFGLANKLKMSVIAASLVPAFFYMNPLDWGDMETERRGTGDNAFTGGSGAISYVNNGLTPMLWALPVVLSNNIPVGTMICKSRDSDMLVEREGVTIDIFDQDTDNVQKNLLTIRGEARVAELNFKPAGIASGLITGIT